MTKKKKKTRGVESYSISEQQKIIIKYLVEDYLTIPQIANKRGTSVQAVYKTIAKLKRKGLLKHKSGGFNRGFKNRGVDTTTLRNNDNKIYRYHALSFTIKILNTSKHYFNILKNKNKDEIENNSISLEKDNLTIYLNKDFWSSEVTQVVRDSLEYIERLIVKLENQYKIILQTNRKCNIKHFRGHIAKTNDPYARELNLNKDQIKIYDDNGQLRLLVDNSFNYHELETVHKDHHIKDMNKLNDKWLDLIKTDLKLSEVEKHLAQIQQYQVTNEQYKADILIMLKALTLQVQELKK